jgi:NitT/TauT family transport system permease protein
MSTTTIVRDEAAVTVTPPVKAERENHGRWREFAVLNGWRLLIVASFLALWQFVPKIPGISDRIVWLDPFFISSPTLVAARVWDVCTGANGSATIWAPLWFTVYTALIGTGIAVVIGGAGGLALSNNATAERVFRPIVAALNAVPRIAIVPIVVIIAQTPAGADITTAVAVVVGLIFYNALEGGRSVPGEMVDGARLMGASRFGVMFRIRLPYVAAWVFAAMPSAFAFGLVGSVTTEIFTGAPGIGHLLQVAVNTADATLTFTVVFMLTLVGVTLVQGTESVRRKVLPWWNA